MKATKRRNVAGGDARCPWLRTLLPLTLWTLAACGGSDGGPTSAPEPAALTGTLAYVENGCREDATALNVEAQRLRVQRAGGETVTVAEIPGYGPFDADGTCELFGRTRFGFLFRLTGSIERLAVAPDGGGLVYEVSDEFSVPRPEPLPPEEQGFFFVNADGSGRQRLGPASREPTYRLFLIDDAPAIQEIPDLAFSPDGHLVTFSDTGPGPDGDTVQIFTLDVRSGQRTQVTHLPIVPGENPPDPPSCCPRFLDDRTITFPTLTDADGSNPDHNGVGAVVHTDGSGLKLASFPSPLPGSQIVPQFSITGRDRNAVLYAFNIGRPDVYREIFLVSGADLLQLTDYRRFDTSGPLLDIDKSRVFFAASADPLQGNATENCQVFSVDTLGANLRQLTAFDEGAPSINGCFFAPPPGCAVSFVGQDAQTQTLVIHSNCNPLGANPFGAQLFALDPDGGQLRQLTQARGLEVDAEGVVTVQLPAPFAYSGLGN